MDTQGSAIALGQDLEIAAGLGGFYNTKRILLAGHREIGLVVAGDLEEDSGVGAAFVRLAGGMQEAWAESETRGHAFLVANGSANILQRAARCRIFAFPFATRNAWPRVSDSAHASCIPPARRTKAAPTPESSSKSPATTRPISRCPAKSIRLVL